MNAIQYIGVGACEIGEDVESGPQSPLVQDTAGLGGLERREDEGGAGDSEETVTATLTTPTRKRAKVHSSFHIPSLHWVSWSEPTARGVWYVGRYHHLTHTV